MALKRITRRSGAAARSSLYERALKRITTGQEYPVESRALQIGLLLISGAGYLGAILSAGVILAIVIPQGGQANLLGTHLVSHVQAFVGSWGLTIGTLGPVAWLQARTLKSTYKATTGTSPTISLKGRVALKSEKEGLIMTTAVVSTLLSLGLGLFINAVGTALISQGTDFWYRHQTLGVVSVALTKVLSATLTEWLFDLVYLVRTNLINKIVSASKK
jgi:hypothetical protein